jgi:hypothetical protein
MSIWVNELGEPIVVDGAPVSCVECPCDDIGCVCDISWTFTDEGGIDGGQDGALREYASPSLVSNPLWTVISTCGLRVDWEHSDDVPVAYGGTKPPTTGAGCANHNPYTQLATATGTFTLAEPGQISITWTGLGEQQDEEYEQMSVYIDGVLLSRAHAPGGDLGCTEPAEVVSEPATAALVCYPLSAGLHEIEVRASTNDRYYHVGAYYRFILHCGSGCEIPSCCIDPEETGPTAVIVGTPGEDECEWTFTSASTAGSCGGTDPESCLWLWTITTELGNEITGQEEDADCSGFTINILDILCDRRASGVEADCPLGSPGDLVDINCTCGIHTITVTLVYTDPAGCVARDTEEFTCGCEITEVPTYVGFTDRDPEDCVDCDAGCCKDITITYPEFDSCGYGLCLMHNLPGGPGLADDCPCESAACVSGTGSGTMTVTVPACVESGLDFSMYLIRSGTCCVGPTVVVDEVIPCGCDCCGGGLGGAMITVAKITAVDECPCEDFNGTYDVPANLGTCSGLSSGEILITCEDDTEVSLYLDYTVHCDVDGYYLTVSFAVVVTGIGTVYNDNETFDLGETMPVCADIAKVWNYTSANENGPCNVWDAIKFTYAFY